MTPATPSDRPWAAHVRATQTRVAVLAILLLTAIGALAPAVPIAAQLVMLLAGVVTLGMPHGAMDHRVAEVFLRPRIDAVPPLAGHWGLVFAASYLGLAAVVIGLWALAPLPMLLAFLAYSAVHFGLGDVPGAPFDRVLARGLLPILLPAAIHPAETAHFLGVVAAAPIRLDAWLPIIRTVTAAALLAALVHSIVGRRLWSVLEVLALTAANVVFPPLLAFGLYFVLLHSTRHLIELADWLEPRRPQLGLRRIARESVPLTLATLGLMSIGFLLIDRSSIESGLVRVLFVTLSALTVPHMLLTELAGHDSRRRTSRVDRAVVIQAAPQ